MVHVLCEFTDCFHCGQFIVACTKASLKEILKSLIAEEIVLIEVGKTLDGFK